MDSDRKNRRHGSRVGDEQHRPDLLLLPGQRSIRNRSSHIVLEDADMGIVMGPTLKSKDGYSFDIWTAGTGLTGGYPYRRIEDVHYARNATIKASAQRGAVAAIVCQTLDEFIAKAAV